MARRCCEADARGLCESCSEAAQHGRAARTPPPRAAHETPPFALLLAALLTLCSAVPSGAKPLALDPTKPIAHYLHRSWTAEAGVPAGIRSLAQTSDGYLWLGTEAGLARFDGRKLTTFTQTNTPVLPGHAMEVLLALRDGALLIGTKGGGIALLENGKFSAFTSNEGLRSDEITALLEARDGTIWIGTGAGLNTWDRRGAFRSIPTFEGNAVSALAEAVSGDIWVGGSAGVAHLSGGSWKTFGSAAGVAVTAVSAIVSDRDGVWLATRGNGLLRFAGGEFRLFTERHGLANDYILSLAAANGALWIGTAGGGLTRFADGRFSHFRSTDGLIGDYVWSVIEDRDGMLWIATEQGLNRLKTPSVAMIDTSHGLSHKVALPILQSRSGEVWIGTAGGGLNRYAHGVFTNFTTADGLGTNVVISLAEDRDGSLLIGTTGGISRFSSGTIRDASLSDEGAQLVALSMLVDRSGSLWIGTQGSGIYRHDRNGLTNYTVRDGLAGHRVYDFLEDRQGRLWIATGDGGLSLFERGRFFNLTSTNGLPTNAISSLTEGRDGTLWVPTSGAGLVRIQNGKISTISTKNGLPDDAIHRVLEDERGDLWLSSNSGIFRLSRQTLQDFDAGRIQSLVFRVFRSDEGMASRECNGGVDPAGWKMRDGSLWFPTMAGVAIIDPKAIANSVVRPAPVIIEQVTVGREARDPHTAVSYLAGPHDLQITFTSPTLSAPGALTYFYMLEGFDAGWINAGERTVAYYTQLPHGDYRFHVVARTPDGVATLAGEPLPVTVRPRFFQRRSFYIAIALVCAAAAYLVYRARIHVLKTRERELRALFDERARGEEALRRSEQHFRSLIENASDMILTLSPDERIVYASPSVHPILGYTPDELRGQLVSDFIPAREEAAAIAALYDPVIRSDAGGSVSFRFRHADGTSRLIEAKARHLRASEGEEAIILNCRDNTERQLLQNQLEQASRLTSLGRLAATVAHEFNNVLMGIQPFADILERQPGDQSVVRSSTERISAAVKRGRRITQEILRYARPEEPQFIDISVRDWVEALAPELRALAGPAVQINVNVSGELAIRGDREQLHQVMTNLILNARDAMPSGGTIGIDAVVADPRESLPLGIVPATGRYIRLTVRDSGAGMPDEVRTHIFEPLFTTKRSGGTGLGLTVVHQIIRRHGGDVFVESAPGEGSAFHLLFPLVEQLAPAASLPVETAAQEGNDPSGGRALRIVIVDDEHAIREGLEVLLASEGMEVATAGTGAEALDTIGAFQPDVVVLDIGLPDVDGAHLYERIAADWPQLAVIFSTGHGDQSKLQEYLSRSNVAFLLKPYDFSTLVEALRRQVERTGEQ